MSEFLEEEFIEENGPFVSFTLVCLDCEHEVLAYIPFGFDPEIKCTCPNCKSRNTERE